MSPRTSLSRNAARLQLTGAATGVVGLAVVFAAIDQALTDVNVGARTPTAFRLFGLDLTAPSLNVSGFLLLLLAAAGAAIVLAGLRSAWRLERGRRSLLRSLTITGERCGAVVFAGERPVAFCAGYVRPRVYISRAAVASVSDDELRAVLAHEDEHRRRRDPLRLACARVLCDALFFLPVLRALRDRSAALAELLADDAAVAASAGDPAPLAAAMLTFGTGPRGTVVGIAPERVDYLMGRPLTWRAPVLMATTSLIGELSLGLLTWQVG